MELYIGTSGYSYPHWAKGVFYPSGLGHDQWLEFYSRQFNGIELNVTFDQLPDAALTGTWQKTTPKEFRFVVKGSRFITHIQRLKDVEESLKLLLENMAPLKSKISAFLWQLPPAFKKDYQRLKAFCHLLKKAKDFPHARHVFEFRDQSWFDEEVYALLKDLRYCLCFADSPEKIGDEVLTTDFVYLRFHGGSVLFDSNYSYGELQSWADKVAGFKGRIKTVYAFFNNDANGYAVMNAQRFRLYLLEKKL